MRALRSAFLCLIIAAPLIAAPSKFRRNVDRVPGEYIVVFRNDVAGEHVFALSEELARGHNANVETHWNNVIKGFAVRMPEVAAIALSNDPRIDFVEENARVFASPTQTNSPWHLDRTDQRYIAPPAALDNEYQYCSTASSVRIYVVDTGVLQSHSEFSTGGASRVAPGADFSIPTNPYDNSSETNPCGGTDNYNAGHGTAVASVAAGNTFGIAKAAVIVPVRVLGCNATGTAWTIINGLEWIYDDWTYVNTTNAVVTMSVFQTVSTGGAGNISALESAVQQLITLGLQVVASANNQNNGLCDTTPARMADVVTVGGTDEQDSRWVCDDAVYDCSFCGSSFRGSNFGSCVKIFAPARNIRAAHILTNTAERQQVWPGFDCDARSGTSFSAPLVAGVIARYLGEAGGYRSPTQIRSWLYSTAGSTSGLVVNAGTGSQNRLVYKDSACP